jgi:hypothetical protein
MRSDTGALLAPASEFSIPVPPAAFLLLEEINAHKFHSIFTTALEAMPYILGQHRSCSLRCGGGE